MIDFSPVVIAMLVVILVGCKSRSVNNSERSIVYRIAFDSRPNGVEEIFTVNPDGTDIRRITHTTPRFSCCPRWSPDHTQIAFISNRDGDEEVYIMDVDGDNTKRLTFNPGNDWSPEWTPDGRQLAFISGPEDNAQVYLIDADGVNQRLMAEFVGPVSGDLNWSPDARRVLFSSVRQGEPEESYLLNLQSRAVRRVFSDRTGVHSANANWLANSEQIVYSSRKNGPLDIYTVNLDGTNEQRVTFSPQGTIGSWALAVSPGGNQIVFSSDRIGEGSDWRDNTEIYVVDLHGNNLARITTNKIMDAHPDW